MAPETLPPCDMCGNDPCDCEAQLEAHYALYPEDAPQACDACGRMSTGLMLQDGLCDRCYRAETPEL